VQVEPEGQGVGVTAVVGDAVVAAAGVEGDGLGLEETGLEQQRRVAGRAGGVLEAGEDV